MRRVLSVLVLLAGLALSGCGGDGEDSSSAASPAPSGYSQSVRDNFLTSCVENATETSDGSASEEELTQTCACILGKVEEEYSEAEFADFEQRLLNDEATDAETTELTTWSTECAREATS